MAKRGTTLAWALLVVAVVVICLASSSYARLPRVGVVTGESQTEPNMQVYMSNAFPGGTGFWKADGDDDTNSSPPLSWLLQWDAVLIFQDDGWPNQTFACQNFAAYADQGGRVVMGLYATFTDTETPNAVCNSGEWNATYLVMVPEIGDEAYYRTQVEVGVIHLPSHPIVQGLTNITTYGGDHPAPSSVLAPGAYRVVDWTDGAMLIAVKDGVGPYNRSRVDLGFYPFMGEDNSGKGSGFPCYWYEGHSNTCLGIPLLVVQSLNYTLQDFVSPPDTSSPASTLSSFLTSFLSFLF